MKLRQLVYFNQVIQQDFNVSAAAKALHTSQPGVSRQLQYLADELGVDLFEHQGKRLVGLTAPGREIAELVADILCRVQRISEVAGVHAAGQRGDLIVVASRHAAGRHLHEAIIRFHDERPALGVRVSEEDPLQALAMVTNGEADLGVLTEPTERHADLICIPIEEWRLVLVAPRDHPLCWLGAITLEALAGHPLCTYERTAASRRVIDEAFRREGLSAPIAFALGSSDLILQYVERGAGAGIIGESAFDASEHPNLVGLDVSHLFRPLTTNVVLRRSPHPSDQVCRFVRLLAPSFDATRLDGHWN
ncbi:LysR substrate-binding domain-containing protein [Thiococcus pfennigii]|uniref:LysR substrate-binding domain-containing protein n=1 Tax=Thiococcus pfennigii TaxID=1057 RepID=UPI00190682CE|nr:hypothetical protein [Thiococcus pfennigii]